MFKEDTLCMLIKNWWKYTPEDELYYRLEENPHWPFKMVADGYYYVIVQSDRAAYGLYGLLVTVIAYLCCTAMQGFYAIPQTFFVLSVLGCVWALRGRIGWRELIISRRGKGSYMLRVLANREKLIQHELRNVYIRLTNKEDASGSRYYWLNLSGYELDDYRITRMTKAEPALRVMGMQLAYRLGVNFFDWKDESEDHFVFHYKTYSRLIFHPQHEPKSTLEKSDDDGQSDDDDSHGQTVHRTAGLLDPQSGQGLFLAVPTRKKRGDPDMDGSPAKKSRKDESLRRNVAIGKSMEMEESIE